MRRQNGFLFRLAFFRGKCCCFLRLRLRRLLDKLPRQLATVKAWEAIVGPFWLASKYRTRLDDEEEEEMEGEEGGEKRDSLLHSSEQ